MKPFPHAFHQQPHNYFDSNYVVSRVNFGSGTQALVKYLILILFACGFLPACAQETFEEKLQGLYHHTVPLIQPQELAQWTTEKKQLVLLDTRSLNEYEVSHIKGAEFVDFETFEAKEVSSIPKTSTVVVYCSVGYRSERVGEKMKALGFRVYNLYGGIFSWKNQGYQVINRHNQPTDSVHAYNRLWGQWLEKGIKVYD